MFVFKSKRTTFVSASDGRPLRKAKTYIEHFFRKEECSTFFLTGCVLPGVMVPSLIQWFICNTFPILTIMVHISTRVSFDLKLESKQVRETTGIISKVLRVVKETIRTRYRKVT